VSFRVHNSAFLIAAGFAATVAASGSTPDWTSLGKRWWAHVEYLAADNLEGRDTGSRGFDMAAQYVAAQFRSAGLRPGGSGGYAQRVEFEVAQIEEAHSSIELVRDGKAEAVKFGEEAYFTASQRLAPRAEGEAVFAGYGLKIPENNYDDFAGQDLRGKIAVYVTGGPADIPSAVKAHYQSGEERRKALAEAGAIGMVAIPNPKAAEVPWSRVAGSRLRPRMELKDPGATAPAEDRGGLQPGARREIVRGQRSHIRRSSGRAKRGETLAAFSSCGEGSNDHESKDLGGEIQQSGGHFSRQRSGSKGRVRGH